MQIFMNKITYPVLFRQKKDVLIPCCHLTEHVCLQYQDNWNLIFFVDMCQCDFCNVLWLPSHEYGNQIFGNKYRWQFGEEGMFNCGSLKCLMLMVRTILLMIWFIWFYTQIFVPLLVVCVKRLKAHTKQKFVFNPIQCPFQHVSIDFTLSVQCFYFVLCENSVEDTTNARKWILPKHCHRPHDWPWQFKSKPVQTLPAPFIIC